VDKNFFKPLSAAKSASSPNPLLPGEKGAIIQINNSLSPSLLGEGFGERYKKGKWVIIYFAFFKIINTFAVTNQIFLPFKVV
jgi:hypothetical protein